MINLLTNKIQYATIRLSQKSDKILTGGIQMINNKVKGEVYAKFKNISELARVLGWSRQKLSLIVNGKREPNLSDIQAMAQALNIDADKLALFFLEMKSQKCDK